MDQTSAADRLRRHQDESLAILAEGARALDAGPAALLAASPGLRARMAAALGGYQHFKHAEIFDPAIHSGDPERAALGRAMKVECIAAGELFRTHTARWTPETISADWTNYRVSTRLTLNSLRRHIVAEGEGIMQLIARYPVDGTG